MTMKSSCKADEQRRRAEVAVSGSLRACLIRACPLNDLIVFQEDGHDGRSHVLADIHVPVGPSEETGAAALEVVIEALGEFQHAFVAPWVIPDIVIVSDDDALYVRHVVRIEISPFVLA